VVPEQFAGTLALNVTGCPKQIEFTEEEAIPFTIGFGVIVMEEVDEQPDAVAVTV
jgi:hypothetical protein